MTKQIQVFAEYKIKEIDTKAYEQAMTGVITRLKEDGATNIQWYTSVDQENLYVEMYTVSSMSDYTTIKQKRKDEREDIYRDIHPFIEGNAEKLHMWAFASVK
jgi:hypothetical protein